MVYNALMQKSWMNRPYYSIGDYYRNRFGERVYKISVNVADTCPNRLGLKGMQTCTFCDVWGSAAYTDIRELTLEEQIQNVEDKLLALTEYNKFFVYFQSYTNTFSSVKKLEAMYETALLHPRVIGIVVGTRPDCLSPALLEVWRKLAQKTYLSIELGIQSFYNDFLLFEKRGHTAEQSLKAIYDLAQIPNLDIGLHFIFGHPQETKDHAIKQAKFLAELPVHSVKLHNLHVLKNTKLEKFYNLGLFKPVELNQYAEMVGAFLQYLPERIAVHRLCALASRWEELIAPEWTKHKKLMFQSMIDYMHSKKIYHGELSPESESIPHTQTLNLPQEFQEKIMDHGPFDEVLNQMPREELISLKHPSRHDANA